MEAELIWADPIERWSPWEADDYLYFGIMSGALVPDPLT